MSVKVEYYQTAWSDSLVTAVWDETSGLWSVQLLLPETIRQTLSILIGERAGFKSVGSRNPTYLTNRDVQVGTSGQRQLFRRGSFHAEYWKVSRENGGFGGTLLVWGRHLGQLLGLLRKLLGEPINKATEVASNLRFGTLPISFIRVPDRRSGMKITDRVASICADGMLAWNVRLALYRMSGTGQPIGDQMTVDCLTGGHRYNFFHAGLGTAGCFSGEMVAVVPRLEVLKRGSIRTHHTDSGATAREARINRNERASTLLAPMNNTERIQEVLVLGQIPPKDLVFIVQRGAYTPLEICNEIEETCGGYGVECYTGERGAAYELMSGRILPLNWRRSF